MLYEPMRISSPAPAYLPTPPIDPARCSPINNPTRGMAASKRPKAMAVLILVLRSVPLMPIPIAAAKLLNPREALTRISPRSANIGDHTTTRPSARCLLTALSNCRIRMRACPKRHIGMADYDREMQRDLERLVKVCCAPQLPVSIQGARASGHSNGELIMWDAELRECIYHCLAVSAAPNQDASGSMRCGQHTKWNQKLNFNANWISRGPRVAVIRPKFGLRGLPKLGFGLPSGSFSVSPKLKAVSTPLKFVWLKALNISARNWRL